MSVSMKPFDVQVHEINVKINTFKIGDGLIFGYVPRRYIPLRKFTSHKTEIYIPTATI